jgi:hypothetical protein
MRGIKLSSLFILCTDTMFMRLNSTVLAADPFLGGGGGGQGGGLRQRRCTSGSSFV